jgi:hypothetical protein
VILAILNYLILALASPALAASAEWGGALTLERTQFVRSVGDGTNDAIDGLRAELTASKNWRRAHKLKLSLDGQWQPDNNSQSEKLFGNATEAYYEYKSASFVSQVGMNTFSWGITDVYNPLDVINPRQYYDPFNSEKLGVPSILLKEKAGSMSFEVVYVPWQLRTLLPGENSRWLPRGQLQVTAASGDYTIVAPNDAPTYVYEKDQVWDNALSNNMAARWLLHAGHFDFSLEGYEGVGSFPDLVPDVQTRVLSVSPQIDVALESQIGLRPNYYRERLGGGSVEATRDHTIFRLASTYWDVTNSHPDVPSYPSWSQENIFGIEQSFALRSLSFTTILQAVYNQRSLSAENDSLSLSHLLDRAAMLGLRLASEGSWQGLLFMAVDTLGNGSVYSARFYYTLSDYWKVAASGNMIRAKSGSQMTDYNDNDNLGLSLTRSW